MTKAVKSGLTAPAATASIARRPSDQALKKKQLHQNYRSEGVKDHDVFLLPASDYQAMAICTLLATIVRLFRIYQPSSVVFDEVQ